MNDSDRYGELTWNQQALVSELLDRFEDLWEQGQRPRPEDWISQAPAELHPIVRRELIRSELYFRRIELGDWPSPETLVADHSEWRDEFVWLLGFEIGLVSRRPLDEPHHPDDTPADKWMGHSIERDSKRWLVLLEIKGQGGQAHAFGAWDFRLNRQVIVKLSRKPWPEAGIEYGQFLQEAKALAGVRHQNILTVHDYSVEEGHPFLVTDYIRGPNLDGQFQEYRTDASAAARIVSQIAQGISVAHRNGVIHRDIKPGNILLDEQIHPVLIDFGLACLSDAWKSPDDKAPAEIAGTLSYMAPEQLGYGLGRVDPRTDVFGLGGVLYFLATGKSPFPPTLSLTSFEVDETPLHDSSFPSALIAICLRALKEKPTDRYQTATEMADDLQQWLDSLDTKQPPADRRGTESAPNLYACNLFTRRLQDAEHIVGRESRLARIDNWLNDDPDGGVFLVQGEPGIGKTGLMTKLVSSRGHCLRHFLSRGGLTGSPANCLRNLIAQLLTQFSRELTELNLPSQSELDQQSLSQLQSTWFQWLQSVAERRPSADRPVVVVLDALDELEWTGRTRDEHPLGFLDSVPPGIACIVSSRVSDATSRGSQYRLPFQPNPETRSEIGRDDPDHIAAVETYLNHRLDQPQLADLLRRRSLSRHKFFDDLIQRAQFNFMYLHYVFRELEQAAQDTEPHRLMDSIDLRRLPTGLTDYYRDHWERLWEHQERNLASLSVLVCLTSSEGREWNVPALSSLIAISPEELITLLYERWEPFLDRGLLDQGILAFYHRSYRDFLRENPVVQATFAAHGTSFDALAGQLAMQHSVDWLDS